MDKDTEILEGDHKDSETEINVKPAVSENIESSVQDIENEVISENVIDKKDLVTDEEMNLKTSVQHVAEIPEASVKAPVAKKVAVVKNVAAANKRVTRTATPTGETSVTRAGLAKKAAEIETIQPAAKISKIIQSKQIVKAGPPKTQAQIVGGRKKNSPATTGVMVSVPAAKKVVEDQNTVVHVKEDSEGTTKIEVTKTTEKHEEAVKIDATVKSEETVTISVPISQTEAGKTNAPSTDETLKKPDADDVEEENKQDVESEYITLTEYEAEGGISDTANQVPDLSEIVEIAKAILSQPMLDSSASSDFIELDSNFDEINSSREVVSDDEEHNLTTETNEETDKMELLAEEDLIASVVEVVRNQNIICSTPKSVQPVQASPKPNTEKPVNVGQSPRAAKVLNILKKTAAKTPTVKTAAGVKTPSSAVPKTTAPGKNKPPAKTLAGTKSPATSSQGTPKKTEATKTPPSKTAAENSGQLTNVKKEEIPPTGNELIDADELEEMYLSLPELTPSLCALLGRQGMSSRQIVLYPLLPADVGNPKFTEIISTPGCRMSRVTFSHNKATSGEIVGEAQMSFTSIESACHAVEALKDLRPGLQVSLTTNNADKLLHWRLRNCYDDKELWWKTLLCVRHLPIGATVEEIKELFPEASDAFIYTLDSATAKGPDKLKKLSVGRSTTGFLMFDSPEIADKMYDVYSTKTSTLSGQNLAVFHYNINNVHDKPKGLLKLRERLVFVRHLKSCTEKSKKSNPMWQNRAQRIREIMAADVKARQTIGLPIPSPKQIMHMKNLRKPNNVEVLEILKRFGLAPNDQRVNKISQVITALNKQNLSGRQLMGAKFRGAAGRLGGVQSVRGGGAFVGGSIGRGRMLQGSSGRGRVAAGRRGAIQGHQTRGGAGGIGNALHGRQPNLSREIQGSGQQQQRWGEGVTGRYREASPVHRSKDPDYREIFDAIHRDRNYQLLAEREQEYRREQERHELLYASRKPEYQSRNSGYQRRDEGDTGERYRSENPFQEKRESGYLADSYSSQSGSRRSQADVTAVVDSRLQQYAMGNFAPSSLSGQTSNQSGGGGGQKRKDSGRGYGHGGLSNEGPLQKMQRYDDRNEYSGRSMYDKEVIEYRSPDSKWSQVDLNVVKRINTASRDPQEYMGGRGDTYGNYDGGLRRQQWN